MDAPRYRIGNDLSVFWAIHNRDGSPFDMEGMDVRLFVTNDRGRKEVDVFLATLPDGTINNVIRWDFKGEDQRVLGLHTLTVEISDSATHREIIRDYCQAFELVGRSELETEEGDANISIGGDLILSSKLDIYRFEATNVDLSGIKETIHDLNETIKDINEEAIEIKVTINGIQSQVNDIGTELTNKASVETVVEIGEQITEVQTNVAEQTIKVNSLGAEIATKASAESVTQIADELAITNESLAEQVIKVTDLTAEVSTKASSEMVTEISDNLKITNDTLAEQTLKVDALSSEISTKASTESVTQIGKDLTLVNETVAEQTIKVSDLESEIATKASSESVLTLEGDVTAVEKAVAEQTIKVEGLEASIESKVSKEEFNEKTGELDTKYTNLKQTADNLTIEVGEQGESLTKVVADVNGLSVRVDDIGEAQANYDNTLSELTDILSPEEMSTQIGKGVVLSTVIGTRDADGNITAGMNASSVHSDPVHGRVVFAGGVKNKTDWTKATGIIYEDGHIVMNSGEFGENVKIGNAMFRAVLEGDFDLFSYPENGTLVPLFQVNKDSSGKIVSISTPYDFTVNRNLVVFGDASSGDGGEGGSSSVGIQGITLNGTTYRDENSDGIIDLGTIGGGTLTEITYEMIVDALGYTPANRDSLGSLAYKNGLTASEVGALSTSGGTINSNTYDILVLDTSYAYGDARIHLKVNGESKSLFGWSSALGTMIYNATNGYALGIKDDGTPHYNGSTLYHTGNFNPADYLPLSGGTITGVLTISDKSTAQNPFLWFSINNSVEAGIGYYADYGTYLYNGESGKILGIFDNGIPHFHFQPLLHSGNYSDYALPLSGGTITGNLIIQAGSGDVVTNSLYPTVDNAYTLGNGSRNWNNIFTYLINGYTPIHAGNVGSYALPIGGGTLTGDLNVAGDIVTKSFWSGTDGAGLYIEGKSNVGIRIQYNKSETGHDYDQLILKNGVISWNNNPLLHSGNVGEYASLNGYLDGNVNFSTLGSGIYKTLAGIPNVPFDSVGNSIIHCGFDVNAATQLFLRYNYDELFYRRMAGGAWNDWKQVAFTDSNVASAQALTHSNGTVGATAYADGKVYFENGVLLKNNSSGISALDANNGYRSILALGSDNNLYFGLNTQSDQMRIYGSPIRFFIGGTDAMRINTSGNVTIGASDKALGTSKLYIDGRVSLFESLNFTRESWNYITVPSTSGNLAFNIGDAGTTNTKMCVLNNGHVLIGTTTDQERGSLFQVNGSGYFGADTYLANWAYLRSYKTDGTKVSVIGINNNNLLLINGQNTGVNTAILGGEVGIGTTNPQCKLDVNGTFRCNALRTSSTTVTYWGSSDEGILSWDTTYASVMAKSGLDLRFGIDGTPYITIASNGAVTMASTLSVGGYMTFNNGDIMYARDEGGTLRYIMGLTSVLSLGYESAYAGIDTHIYGNSIHLHHGTSRGTGLSLYSDGSSQLHGNTTINGNLVVKGDISA